MFQMRTGADLEREMGWWRIGIIYMTSGILGFVFGGNFAQLLSRKCGGHSIGLYELYPQDLQFFFFATRLNFVHLFNLTPF